MLAYYFNLALRSFRRNKVLTALMVLAIALGIGASMTTLTVFYVLSGDPIPGRSHALFHPQLDPQALRGYQEGEEPPIQLTRFDAETLLREKKGDRQAMMTGGSVSITPQNSDLAPFRVDSRYTSTDMFTMFDMPFLHGNGWGSQEDDAHARVVVITKSLNEKLFGGANSVGKTIHVDKSDLTIVGVLDDWRPTPRFYDMFANRGYGDGEDVFVPFSTSRDLKMDRSGSMDCWGDSSGDETDVNAPCVWIQYWVQLDSPDKAEAYRQYLSNYSDQQRAAGRFERPNNIRLRNLMEWLDFNRIVPSDVVMQMWLAFAFLAVCLLNTVGLLLAKFLRRSGEIGVRRALGATRTEVFKQFLVEAGAVGLAGGVLGLGLALLGLWAVRQQPVDYADLAHLDPWMLLATFAVTVVASLLAGVLPAWRAMQITPAVQLKSQ
ncbi:ABC transporter ATP-binding protein [Pseudoxanthomonas kalamensis DSM 18571]|uniref:ABC transporter permease n=1 Tax=Pseudoxanthomonas kalamensis TaxID=289483 RepID=UPI001391B0A4|nr:ABC transporter permease [Pseudoxanthomonas kalamensis]KAF1712590.1 ABC transporter ATP-binding protein [Pseudoxanthomonas kalamensis DSM 18571]